jgi:ABC-type multidrug transport system fused ATPase/permease subunit
MTESEIPQTPTDTLDRTGKIKGIAKDIWKSDDPFEDRVDKETGIGNREALKILWRSLKLLARVRGLFTAKILLASGMMIPGIFLPWIGKIVTDNAILQRPFGDTAVPYPPFMNPLINYLDGMAPYDIMITMSMIFFAGLFLMGMGAGGKGKGSKGGLYGGKDTATQAENKISSGGSSAGGIWGVVEFWVDVRMTQTIVNKLRTRLFDRLTRLPMTAVDDQRIGDSIYRVLYDAAEVPNICYMLSIIPFFVVLKTLINLYLMDYSYGDIAPQLVWIAWAMMPIYFVITYPLSAWLRRTGQAKRAAGSATTNAMEEAMNSISAVQSLGGTKQEKDRFAKRSWQSFLRDRYDMVAGMVPGIVGGIATAIAGLYVIILVTDKIIEGVMSQGDFFVLMGIYGGMAMTAAMIGAYWIKLQGDVAAIRRVFFFIDHISDEDRPGSVPLGPIERGVTLEQVDFTYPDGRQALRDINLDLKMGELAAFVGPTGAGKTTLAYLIPSFLQATKGKVLIDGQDVSNVDLDSLRNQISYVFQEHLLLSETIRANLELARPNATEAEMAAALTTAGCMEFIDPLPDGIDTVLGHAGETLSVGQQQRLCIARGLIRDTKILILDEPTAALDPRAENALVEGLQRAAEGRLVIIIAHRLSTIRRADRIVFLEGGEVKAIGNHDALMADPDGPYRRFVELQGG